MVGEAHPKELPFEAFIRLLEECEEDTPHHSTETHPEVLPGTLALKKRRKISTEGGCPKWLHKMANALMKAQLLGCSWARATLTSVKSERPLEAREW